MKTDIFSNLDNEKKSTINTFLHLITTSILERENCNLIIFKYAHYLIKANKNQDISDLVINEAKDYLIEMIQEKLCVFDDLREYAEGLTNDVSDIFDTTLRLLNQNVHHVFQKGDFKEAKVTVLFDFCETYKINDQNNCIEGITYKFNKDAFSRFIIRFFHVCNIDNNLSSDEIAQAQLAFFDGSSYSYDENELSKNIRDLLNITNSLQAICDLNKFLDTQIKNLRLDRKVENKYLACKNCVLEINVNSNDNSVMVTKHSPSPKIIVTNKLNVFYNPLAKSDVLDANLECYADGENARRDRIIESFALGLTLDHKFKREMTFCYSDANCGKSALASFLANIYSSESTSKVSLNDFENNDFSSLNFKGKRINICDELSNRKVNDNAIQLIKKIAGNAAIMGNAKYVQTEEFYSSVKFYFFTNNYIYTLDKALMERMNFLKLSYNFKENNFKYKVDDLLHDENAKSAMFNYMLEAYIRMIQKHNNNEDIFTKCASSEELKKDFLKQTDLVQMFLYSICEEQSTTEVTSETIVKRILLRPNASHEEVENRNISSLFQQFKAWCKENEMTDKVNKDDFIKSITKNYKNLKVNKHCPCEGITAHNSNIHGFVYTDEFKKKKSNECKGA